MVRRWLVGLSIALLSRNENPNPSGILIRTIIRLTQTRRLLGRLVLMLLSFHEAGGKGSLGPATVSGFFRSITTPTTIGIAIRRIDTHNITKPIVDGTVPVLVESLIVVV